jgi:ferredoxin-type protein NapH
MSRNAIKYPGHSAVETRGWFSAHKWLLLRRLSQLGVLGLFLLGPLAGVWLVKGNLSASLTLDTLPLTEPLLLLQMLAAGHLPEITAVIGALIVIGFYALVGGRAYCSWVCPINPVSDAAGWLRRRLGIKGGMQITRRARYFMLGMLLIVCAASGTLAWELVNPVSLLHRGLIFAAGGTLSAVLFSVLAVFFFELFVAQRGWCGHLCPMGALYGLIGSASPLRIRAEQREQCDDCMDCYAICPEPQVITPALKGAKKGFGPVITSRDCTNCGRCIDVCAKDVFQFGTRFGNFPGNVRSEAHNSSQKEITP